MLLLGADKQSSGESVKAHLARSFSRFGQAKPKSILATLGFMPYYLAKVLY